MSAGTSNLDAIKTHLKQAPIQIATSTCSGWSTDAVVRACQASINHATMVFKVDSAVHDFDHYAPYRKQLVASYNIPYAMKYVIRTKAQQNAMEYLKKNQSKLVQNGKTGEIGYVKDGKVLVTSAERAGLLALTTLIRMGQGQAVSDELWQKFPKEKF